MAWLAGLFLVSLGVFLVGARWKKPSVIFAGVGLWIGGLLLTLVVGAWLAGEENGASGLWRLVALALSAAYLVFLRYALRRHHRDNASDNLSTLPISKSLSLKLIGVGFASIVALTILNVLAKIFQFKGNTDELTLAAVLAGQTVFAALAFAVGLIHVGRWWGKANRHDWGWRLSQPMSDFARRHERLAAMWLISSPWTALFGLVTAPLVFIGADVAAGLLGSVVTFVQIGWFLAAAISGRVRGVALDWWYYLWTPSDGVHHNTRWAQIVRGLNDAQRRSRFWLRWAVAQAVSRTSIGAPVPDVNRWWIGLDEESLEATAPLSELPLLVIGATGSGKSSALVLQNAMLHNGPMVVTSTKDELMRLLSDGFAANGVPIGVFDPMGSVVALPPGVSRLSWNVLRGCEEWDVARQRAKLMVQAASSASRLAQGGSQTSESSFWSDTAAESLAALLYGCRVTGRSVADLVEVVAQLGSGETGSPYLALVEALLARETVLPAGRDRTELGLCLSQIRSIDATVATKSENSSSMRLTVERSIAALRSAAVLETLAAADAEFDAPSFLQGGGCLFLVSEMAEQERIAPLFVGLLNDVTEATFTANRLQPGSVETLLLLDEVAQLAPIRTLPALVAEGRGKGLRILAVLQDLSQAEAIWGRAGLAFPSKFPHLVFLPGSRDKQMLETLEALGGKYDDWYQTTSHTSGKNSSTTVAEHKERRSHLEPNDISALKDGQALFFSPDAGSLGWSRVWLTHYFKQPPPVVHPWRDFIGPAGGSQSPAPMATPTEELAAIDLRDEAALTDEDLEIFFDL